METSKIEDFQKLSPTELKQKIIETISNNVFDDLKLFIDNGNIALSSCCVQFVANENGEGLQYLFDNYKTDILNVRYNDRNLLSLASQYGWIEGVVILSQCQELLQDNNQPSHYLYTPLHTSIVYDQFKVVEYLLDNHPNLTTVLIPSTQNNILHVIVLVGNYNILKTVLSKSDTNKLVNQPNHKGLTPLHMAVLTNDINMVTRLVKHGADITAMDKKSRTPIELASNENFKDILEYLSHQSKFDYFENISLH